ncbi:MAG: hypothetical protein JWQ13_41, partial [Ramlibacter sp.]|nr:hypothetical protein [Ramlibacter sp.]
MATLNINGKDLTVDADPFTPIRETGKAAPR